MVDLQDEAYATVLIGLLGLNVDVVRARFCFNGNIEYNLNILQVNPIFFLLISVVKF